MYKPIL